MPVPGRYHRTHSCAHDRPGRRRRHHADAQARASTAYGRASFCLGPAFCRPPIGGHSGRRPCARSSRHPAWDRCWHGRGRWSGQPAMAGGAAVDLRIATGSSRRSVVASRSVWPIQHYDRRACWMFQRGRSRSCRARLWSLCGRGGRRGFGGRPRRRRWVFQAQSVVRPGRRCVSIACPWAAPTRFVRGRYPCAHLSPSLRF